MPDPACVLIADDDPVLRAMARVTLESVGFEVVEAADGCEAIAAFERCKPDLIVLDVMMPGRDGFDVCLAIRAHVNGELVPILILTGLDDVSSIEKAYGAGATDFAEKPPNWAAFPHRVQYLLRASRALQELRACVHVAEAANRAKTEFLTNVSHEIRTPMTAILGNLELLREQDAVQRLCGEPAEALAAIERSGQFLLGLVQDLLETAQSEHGDLSIELASCDPGAIVRQAVEDCAVHARAKGLIVRADVASDVPLQIRSDPRRLRQILQNLLSNAVKFTDQGSLDVRMRADRVTEDTATIVLEVEDTGIGISPDEHSRVFRPFEQVDASLSRRHGGAGLGLTIVDRVVRALQGSIELRSATGQGSCFTVRLPVIVEGQRACAAVQVVTQLRGRLLLAEDSPDNQRLISQLLSRAGAQVAIAGNGREALELLRADPTAFDLVLMDMQMPELDGYATTRALRDAGFERPVIALTAHAMTGDRERCLAAGCSDYAVKPIERTRLLSLVDAWLRKR